MKRSIKWGLLLASVLFVLASVIGILRYTYAERSYEASFSLAGHIDYLETGWTYVTDTDSVAHETRLPAKLPLLPNTTKVTLENTLPSQPIFGGVLRHSVMCQKVSLYIDGKLRYEYGEIDVPLNDFPYVVAAQYYTVELSEEDYGKPISIVMEAPPLFIAELSLARSVLFGRADDLVLYDLLINASTMFISILIIGVVIILLLMSGVQMVRKQPFAVMLLFSLYMLFWLLFYNSDNTLIWSVFSYSPYFASLNDVKYYVMDSFLPLLTYAFLYAYKAIPDKRWLHRTILCHFVLYCISAVLFACNVISINYLRPFLMIVSFVVYCYIFYTGKPWKRKDENRYFILAMMLIMFGYFADYLKYVIALLPLHTDIIVFLQLELPYMFCLGWTLLCACFLLAFGIIEVFQYQRLAMQQQRDMAQLQLTLAGKEYQITLQSMQEIRYLRHDMRHHFNALLGLAKKNDAVGIETYIEGLNARMPKSDKEIGGRNFICSSFLNHYEEMAGKDSIRFTKNIQFDEMIFANQTHLGILLGNALQNAYEAVKQVTDSERFIEVTIKKQDANLIFIVKNSYTGILDKNLHTKKQGDHGMGMASIRSVVALYDGYLDYTAQSQVFTLSLVLVFKK